MRNVSTMVWLFTIITACSSSQISTSTQATNNGDTWQCTGETGRWICERKAESQNQDNTVKIKADETSIEDGSISGSLQQPAIKSNLPVVGKEEESFPEKFEASREVWVIQWIALSSEEAADAFAMKNFSDQSIQIRVVPLKGPNIGLYAVISGEYASKKEALEASNEIARVNTEKPYIKELSSSGLL